MEYLDTSAIVPLFLSDVHSAAMKRHVRLNPAKLAISDLGRVELSATLSKLTRTGDIDVSGARDRLRLIDAWIPVAVEFIPVTPADWIAADLLVRRFELKLRAPDAVHIAICQRVALPLVTFDAAQAGAARTLGVDVIVPRETNA